jgi:uroporphyrinogen-III synthase
MTECSVLVTRPPGQGQALATALQQQGFRPVLQPLIEIEVMGEPSPQQRSILLDLDTYQHIVFVSANAIRHGMEWIENFWPQLPIGIHWYTVGKSSASLLQAYGLTVLQPGGEMSSEALLQLPHLQEVSGQRILLVKGEGGRTLIQAQLEQRGARVETLCCYRRRCPSLGAGELGQLLDSQDFTALLISSGEGLLNLVSLLGGRSPELAREISLVVPGNRVATMAHELGFVRVITADNASDEAMLQALKTIQ